MRGLLLFSQRILQLLLYDWNYPSSALNHTCHGTNISIPPYVFILKDCATSRYFPHQLANFSQNPDPHFSHYHNITDSSRTKALLLWCTMARVTLEIISAPAITISIRLARTTPRECVLISHWYIVEVDKDAADTSMAIVNFDQMWNNSLVINNWEATNSFSEDAELSETNSFSFFFPLWPSSSPNSTFECEKRR